MAKIKQEQESRVLKGDPQNVAVRRCICGAGAGAELIQTAIAGVLSDGLVPFVVAEESLDASVLEFLMNAYSTDARDYVSVRLAAIAKRRERDYHRFFYDAIQNSLRNGTPFIMAFEDDDVGCALVKDEQSDWLARMPCSQAPTSALPDEWRLSEFYDSNVFPMEVFQPALFNGRAKAKLFLPELDPHPVPSASPQVDMSASGNSGKGQESKPPEKDKAPEKGKRSVSKNPQEAKGGKEKRSNSKMPAPEAPGENAVQEQDLPPPPEPLGADAEAALRALYWKLHGEVATGPTGRTFRMPGSGPALAGLQVTHCLRPALAATGSIPAGLSDSEVRAHIVNRFQQHVPLHSTVVVFLCTEAGFESQP